MGGEVAAGVRPRARREQRGVGGAQHAGHSRWLRALPGAVAPSLIIFPRFRRRRARQRVAAALGPAANTRGTDLWLCLGAACGA